MSRVRISTTVDGDLLERARTTCGKANDAALIDEALAALLARHRGAEIDAAYDRGYGEHPIDQPDDWGDLAAWGDAASRS